LKNRNVRFTATAHEHVRREKAWWLANRDHPDVFTEELEQALQIIAALPGAGTLYPQSPVPGIRRVYLRRVAVHLYYTFDDAGVIVRALWGARRERGPRIS
jgi:plasmid stabilization system protein ParE